MSIPRFVIRQEGDSYIVEQANNLILKYFDLNADQVIDHKIEDFMDQESAQHFKQSFEEGDLLEAYEVAFVERKLEI